MILEARSTDETTLLHFEQELWTRAEGELKERQLRMTINLLSQTLPTGCSPVVQDAIEKASSTSGMRSTRLPSGAGHDGVFVARIAPMGMIFVPCKDGRSHTPEEWAEPADCAKGARVLAETLLLLDKSLP
jgi:N-carbamoyl-L-amino-acid hydrolase